MLVLDFSSLLSSSFCCVLQTTQDCFTSLWTSDRSPLLDQIYGFLYAGALCEDRIQSAIIISYGLSRVLFAAFNPFCVDSHGENGGELVHQYGFVWSRHLVHGAVEVWVQFALQDPGVRCYSWVPWVLLHWSTRCRWFSLMVK